MVTISCEDWRREAEKRYGEMHRKIRFRCPSCGYEQSGEDFLKLGMTPEQVVSKVGFSCIGRQMQNCQDAFTGPPGPCNYAGGGLIRIAPIRVMDGTKEVYVFDFADDPLEKANGNL